MCANATHLIETMKRSLISTILCILGDIDIEELRVKKKNNLKRRHMKS